MPNFTLFHADHGINDAQKEYIFSSIEDMVDDDGFFIREIFMDACDHVDGKYVPENTLVPCGLYGPAMGDAPVVEAEMVQRSEDRPADRMIKAPFRQVGYVQAIGIKEGNEFKLFTVYGGPLAPQNPADPNCQDIEASTKFWSEHALAY